MTDDTLDIDDLLDEEPDDGMLDFEADKKPLSDDELRDSVRRLVELRAKRDETKVAASKAKEEFEAFQRDLFERIEASPVKGSRKVDLGDDHGLVQIVPRKTQYGRVLDYDKAVEYFKERGLLDEYVKDDFRMSRLHELVREHLEQKKPLPEGIDFYTKEYFTITFKD